MGFIKSIIAGVIIISNFVSGTSIDGQISKASECMKNENNNYTASVMMVNNTYDTKHGTKGKTGTGFFITEDLFVTAAHVVEMDKDDVYNEKVTLTMGYFTKHGFFKTIKDIGIGSVVAVDANADLALIQVESNAMSKYVKPLSICDNITAADFNSEMKWFDFYSDPKHFRCASGYINRINPNGMKEYNAQRKDYNNIYGTILEIASDGASIPGMSGGPVLNSKDEVVGVVIGVSLADKSFTYAISNNELINFISSYTSANSIDVQDMEDYPYPHDESELSNDNSNEMPAVLNGNKHDKPPKGYHYESDASGEYFVQNGYTYKNGIFLPDEKKGAN